MDLEAILKEAGLEDSAIKSALSKMKANGIYTTSEQNADIRIKKYKEKQKSLEDSLGDLQEKVDGYADFETEKSNLTKEIETLKKEATDKEFNTALASALKDSKSKNDKIITALLDKDKLTIKDGKIEGLEEQLKTIKAENDYLFEKTPAGTPDFFTGGKGGAGGTETKSIGESLAAARSETVEIKY